MNSKFKIGSVKVGPQLCWTWSAQIGVTLPQIWFSSSYPQRVAFVFHDLMIYVIWRKIVVFGFFHVKLIFIGFYIYCCVLCMIFIITTNQCMPIHSNCSIDRVICFHLFFSPFLFPLKSLIKLYSHKKKSCVRIQDTIGIRFVLQWESNRNSWPKRTAWMRSFFNYVKLLRTSGNILWLLEFISGSGWLAFR